MKCRLAWRKSGNCCKCDHAKPDGTRSPQTPRCG
jgi:hypothetical protein